MHIPKQLLNLPAHTYLSIMMNVQVFLHFVSSCPQNISMPACDNEGVKNAADNWYRICGKIFDMEIF